MERITTQMAEIEQQAGLQRMNAPKKITPVPRPMDGTSETQVFERAFEENWTPIYRLLERMLGDPSEAEDMALEAFYRLFRRGNHLEPGFNTSGWLRRVAVNLGLHSIRSFKRRLFHELTAGRLILQESETDSPLQIVAEREMQGTARAVLAQLKPRDSELLLMRYSGSSYNEIAAALHLSPGSIGPLLLRAEREFARQYRALAQEDE